MNIVKYAVIRSLSMGIRFPLGAFDRVGELQTMRGLVGHVRADCVIDVGANRGQFASELRGVGFGGQILSFEPLADEFSVLSKRFAGDKHWKGQQLALGSRAGRMEMVVPGLSVLGSLLQPKFKSPNTRVEMVDIARLDEILPKTVPDWASRRIYLKMDTQGFDLEVFKGTEAILPSVVGLQSELSVRPLYAEMPHYLEALSIYESAGFDLHHVSVVGRGRDNGVVELNCYMSRRA